VRTTILQIAAVLLSIVLLWLFWLPLLIWLMDLGIEAGAAGLIALTALLIGPAVIIRVLRDT